MCRYLKCENCQKHTKNKLLVCYSDRISYNVFQTNHWQWESSTETKKHRNIFWVTRIMFTFRCFPIMFPWFPIIITVFQRVSPWSTSLSRIGLTITMLYLCARSWRNWVDSLSKGSANPHHLFSLVQNPNGMIQAACMFTGRKLKFWIGGKFEFIYVHLNVEPTCKHKILTLEAPTASIMGFTFSIIALF